jgi:sec-independent protein translocase protein TatA
MFSPVQMLILGAIAVLIFGDRLPEVAKSVGKGIMEFKKGLQGLQDELTSAMNSADETAPALTHSESAVEDYEEATAPKFEPPPSPPSPQQSASQPHAESIPG